MATNRQVWIDNLCGASEPLVMLGLFQDGSTQAIKRGEILELTGDGNTAWVPIDSDFAGAANVAVAACEIKAGDRAGFYPITVPRPGDRFEFALDTANNPSLGTDVYYSDSETVSESGNNALAYVSGQKHYPDEQGHLSDDASGDAGTTIRSTSRIIVSFKEAASFFALFAK